MSEFEFDVRADSERNVVFMRQIGMFSGEGAKRLIGAYEKALQKVRLGFVLVNDQSQLEGLGEDGLKYGATLIRMSNEKKISVVIRIVADTLVAKLRMGRLYVEGGAMYQSINVPDQASAERELERILKHGGVHTMPK